LDRSRPRLIFVAPALLPMEIAVKLLIFWFANTLFDTHGQIPVDRKGRGPEQARFWLAGVEMLSPASCPDSYWSLQNRIDECPLKTAIPNFEWRALGEPENVRERLRCRMAWAYCRFLPGSCGDRTQACGWFFQKIL